MELVAEVRRVRGELQDVEVKSAAGGTPGRAPREALSAFANRAGGGVLLFGVDEERDFAIVGVRDAQRIQEEIANASDAELDPPLRPDFTVVEIDGKIVVAVEVPELPPTEKPCHIKSAGLQNGSYIRVGLSNRRMTDYEIYGHVSARSQPTWDADPVRDASLDDLDRAKLDAYLARLRQDRPQSVVTRLPFDQALVRLGIVKPIDGVARPTLAGFLTFGVYPPQFEPQLVVTFLQYYGTTETEPTPRGARFLDNRKFEGTVDEIIEDAVNHVLASIRKSSLIDGLIRRDIPEYPEAAIREAVVNAVAHRDYSPFVRGSYVQIRLFADRLEVQSPGGLFGNVTVETLKDEQSTRNRLLVRFLEDLHIVENRGSGIHTMTEAMRRANLEPPRFDDRRSSFWVTFRNHTLMGPEAIDWLNQFAALPLNDHQRLALVYLLHNEKIANADYRRLNHVAMGMATRDLRGLVHLGLLEQQGAGRWTNYTLTMPEGDVHPQLPPEDLILAFVRSNGSVSNAQVQDLLGVSPRRAKSLLTMLRDSGQLAMIAAGRWTIYRLPSG